MSSFKVGYFVGSLATASINRCPSGAARAADDGDFVQGPAALQLRLRRELPSCCDSVKDAI
jgi:hypothetical protein